MDPERLANRLGNAVVILAVAYLAAHVLLAYVIHQTPDQFIAAARDAVLSIGR